MPCPAGGQGPLDGGVAPSPWAREQAGAWLSNHEVTRGNSLAGGMEKAARPVQGNPRPAALAGSVPLRTSRQAQPQGAIREKLTFAAP